jgi:hypothetical protein
MTIKLLPASPSQRLYFVLISLIGLLLIGLLAGTYGANQLLTARTVKLTNLKAENLGLNQEQLSLAAAQKEVKTYAGLQQIAQSVVPEDKDQAEAVREVVNIASANNVSLGAINFPASTLGSTPAGAVSGTATAPTANPATKSANLNSKTTKLSQLLPVAHIPGVYDLQITVQGDANKPVQYNSFVNFLTALEHNRRTAQISAITLQPSTGNPNLLVFTLTLNEYIKP